MFSSQRWHVSLTWNVWELLIPMTNYILKGLFSRDLRGYKAILALLRSYFILFSAEMAVDSTHYIPAESATYHTTSRHRRETMRIHEKKNILSPLAHFFFSVSSHESIFPFRGGIWSYSNIPTCRVSSSSSSSSPTLSSSSSLSL